MKEVIPCKRRAINSSQKKKNNEEIFINFRNQLKFEVPKEIFASSNKISIEDFSAISPE